MRQLVFVRPGLVEWREAAVDGALRTAAARD